MAEDFKMNEAEFGLYRRFIYDTCGINLGPGKKQLLITRLAKRMRALKITSFRVYREYVLDDASQQELTHMLDAVSTNKTEFFREGEHFEFLMKNVHPSLLQRHIVRIWSAGCSSGEEAYTLAMTVRETLGGLIGRDVKILATDISTKVLDDAELGIYIQDKMQEISPPLQKKYFLKGDKQWSGHYLVKNELKKMIRFRRLNLMEEFPLTVQFHVIFCRNVMIYFDKRTQARLIDKFERQLAPGGYLFIGHSESLSGIDTNLRYIKPTIYQKT
ncbi:MAG: protein-glutamate O-methyltransferase CheR [Proteobacteria bacterium]|nr:protein-glutamate O-methyltransferase CheR [Pseudomonadota bacterium]